ncbi:MAG TPA: hypothetical protein VFU41_12990, partial [Gemmatimonadales bacterium]|nr:hypothetical protein [Gemmatimonadales bacterium]
GFLFFELRDRRFGSGLFRFTGRHPSFTVRTEDGYGDFDYNDAVITVELLRDCRAKVARLSERDAAPTMANKGCAAATDEAARTIPGPLAFLHPL